MTRMDSFERAVEEQVSAEVSENIAEDIVEVSRGNIVENEPIVLLSTFQYATSFMYDMDRYANSVLTGPPGCGKSEAQLVCEELIPSKFVYGGGDITDFSDNAPLDDPTWDRSLLFIGDEYDKINKAIREYMKSMAGGADEGYAKRRNVESDTAEGGYEPVTVSSSAMPFQFLYAPVGSKSGLAEELDDRMLKLPVEDSKQIRTGIQRKEFGHEEISTSGLDHTYIFETVDLEAALRSHLRSLEVVEQYEDGTTKTVVGNESPSNTSKTLDSRRGGCYTVMPRWVAYATDPIFDRNSPHSNRVFGMVSNLIRSSALWDHHERDVVEKHVEGETVDAYLVEAQDVANVLCTQETLLGTTHLLDQRRRDLLDAIDATQGLTEEGAVTLDQIRKWLDDNDKTTPTKQTLRRHLEDLAEDFYVRIRERAGPNNAHLYEMQPHGSIQPPRLYNLSEPAEREGVTLEGRGCADVDDPFDGTVDPIRNQPYKETVEDFREKYTETEGATKRAKQVDSLSAAEAMGGSVDDDGQQSITDVDGETPGVEPPQGPIERVVYEKALNHCGTDGTPFSTDDDVDVEDPHILGIVEEGVEVSKAELSGTVYDPEHEIWSHESIDDERVTSEAEARREIDDAYTRLEAKGLIEYDDDVPDGFLAVRVQEVDDE